MTVCRKDENKQKEAGKGSYFEDGFSYSIYLLKIYRAMVVLCVHDNAYNLHP